MAWYLKTDRTEVAIRPQLQVAGAEMATSPSYGVVQLKIMRRNATLRSSFNNVEWYLPWDILLFKIWGRGCSLVDLDRSSLEIFQILWEDLAT